MDSVLPYSVLKSRRKKFVRIIEEQDVAVENRLRQADYDKNIEDLMKAGLTIYPEHNYFVSRYIYYFFRNNLAVLFLAINILHNPKFEQTNEYKTFVDYIQRRTLGDDKYEKQDMFEHKLKIQLFAYTKKIQNLMIREHILNI